MVQDAHDLDPLFVGGPIENEVSSSPPLRAMRRLHKSRTDPGVAASTPHPLVTSSAVGGAAAWVGSTPPKASGCGVVAIGGIPVLYLLAAVMMLWLVVPAAQGKPAGESVRFSLAPTARRRGGPGSALPVVRPERRSQ